MSRHHQLRKVANIIALPYLVARGFVQGFVANWRKERDAIRRADIAHQRFMVQIQATTAIIKDMEYSARLSDEIDQEVKRRLL